LKHYIGCDAHQKYSVFVTVDETGRVGQAVRVENDRAGLRQFLRGLPAGAPVAVEASGGWYWLIDELEAAGLDPHLANPKEAKQRMRGRNKTDKLDATGLAILLRNGTLPEVWIPDAALRDLRGLLRTRLAMRRQTTFLKNRISAAIRRYGLREDECSDLFAGKGRVQLSYYIGWLPEQTRHAAIQEWELLDEVEARIAVLELRIKERIGSIGYTRLLKTLPGVGEILGATIYLEIGDVKRFPTAAHLASYAGLVPTVYASGGKTWMGHTPPTANHFLKWAFIEAANCVVRHQKKYALAHVTALYQRLKPQKGHAKASVALARHLAEASWWMLSKHQVYREPAPAAIASSKNG
jgi:transposase